MNMGRSFDAERIEGDVPILVGDILYGAATEVFGVLNGNITTTQQLLAQTGNGAISAAPVWTATPTLTSVALTGFLTESVTIAITAGTTRTQGGATALTTQYNRVDTSTAPTAGTVLGDGVALPVIPATVGRRIFIWNNTANPIQVYALNGGSDTINGVAGSTGIIMPANAIDAFISMGAGSWAVEAGIGFNGTLPTDIACDSITANATGTSAASTVCTAEVNHILTAANTSAPYSAVSAANAAKPGTEYYFENNGANPIQIFPIIAGTDTINGLAANASIVLPVSASVILKCSIAGAWTSNPYFNAVGALPGNLGTQMGASTAATGIARPGGNISNAVIAAGQGNGADLTDDVLQTFALPANSLDIAGRQVIITALGKFASNGNNKRIKIWWGTTTQTPGLAVAGGVLIADSGVVTTNGGGWNAIAMVTKYGAPASNTQIGNGSIVAGVTHTGTVVPPLLTATESAIINITITGASSTTGAANDILGQMFNIQFAN
jgi:hypothetical protein